MENTSLLFSTKYTGSFALFSTLASLCCGSIVISVLKEKSEAEERDKVRLQGLFCCIFHCSVASAMVLDLFLQMPLLKI